MSLVNEVSDYGPLFPVESTLVTNSIFKDFDQNDFRVEWEKLSKSLQIQTQAGYTF